MSFTLPPRPDTQPTAGPSRLQSTILPTPTTSADCAICSQPAKYTCPRCSFRTCSLPCSKTHKSRDSCSGVRDPAKYVPLKEYGQGAWSDDYRWLEEGRRKVGGWGEGVKIEEVSTSTSNTRGRGGMRGGGSAGGTRGGGLRRPNRTDGLRKELANRGCEVSFMPEGMGRKKLNQSSWNPKSQQLHITLHLSISQQLLDPTSADTSTKTISHNRVLFAASEPTTMPILSSFLPPSLVDTTSDLVFAMPFHSTPSRPAPDHAPGQKLFYPPLDSAKSFAEVLRGTAWVEFPVIHVMKRSDWESSIEKGTVGIVPVSQGSMQTRDSGWGAKRRVQVVEEREDEEDSTKRARTMATALNIPGPASVPTSTPTEGLMALGEYESDSEVEDEVEEGELDKVDDEMAALEGETAEDDPPPEMLEAVGMALIADLGEA
ncbi:hypothetical protein CI109_102448 [Kwoniella shandongensis]|uniref:Box C/D snoRNA protein 1 n=1 Tax=Kwoniella shandongensis TaxID=1734106 RepID=A0A5M6C4C1_9TREE|nr:uncharacterized protein CI109_003233 [Kwoniella shandongensis]KAA5528335.1 hypothetical protein CI109_003233 [Kwoniella shandongensis]